MSYLEHEKRIQDIITFIEQRLTDKIKLDSLADHAGYSRFHFQRIFRKITGKSVSDYIRARRMSQAARDLISTDQRVIDIALYYHFGSQESFTRAFKKEFNMAPGRYR